MYYIADYIEIYRDTLGIVQETDIRAAACGDTEEWDSFMHMELIAAMEERFNLKFTGEDVLRFLSFEEGMVILQEKGICFADMTAALRRQS